MRMSHRVCDHRRINVIGFPKSGNTWLSRLLSDTLEYSIHSNDKDDIINNATNIRSSYRGLIHKLHDKEPSKFSDKDRLKTVYITRDVRAVVVSGFFHNYRSLQNKEFNPMQRAFFNYEIKKLSKSWNSSTAARINDLKRKVKFQPVNTIGNWSDHIQHWHQQAAIVVRYEDLLIDTKHKLISVLNALDEKYDPKILDSAVSGNTFLRMKEKFSQKNDSENLKFLRSGATSDWKQFLNKNIEEDILKINQIGMELMNYER